MDDSEDIDSSVTRFGSRETETGLIQLGATHVTVIMMTKRKCYMLLLLFLLIRQRHFNTLQNYFNTVVLYVKLKTNYIIDNNCSYLYIQAVCKVFKVLL